MGARRPTISSFVFPEHQTKTTISVFPSRDRKTENCKQLQVRAMTKHKPYTDNFLSLSFITVQDMPTV